MNIDVFECDDIEAVDKAENDLLAFLDELADADRELLGFLDD